MPSPNSVAPPFQRRPHRFRRPLAALLPAALALASLAGEPVPAPAPQPSPATPAPEAAKPAPDAPAPEVSVVGEASFDFGRVWSGQELKHAFTLKNSGKAELKILRLQPG